MTANGRPPIAADQPNGAVAGRRLRQQNARKVPARRGAYVEAGEIVASQEFIDFADPTLARGQTPFSRSDSRSTKTP